MSNDSLLQVHDYWQWPGRYDLVNGWWTEHRGAAAGIFPENLIPPMAAIVTSDGDPVVFLAAYEAVGVGVSILDWACSKPGIGAGVAKRAFLFAADSLREALKAHGYAVCITYTLPTIGRVLARNGWQDHGMKQQFITAT